MNEPAPAGPDALVVFAYEAHHADVFAFLARTTQDRAAAEDVLQATYRRLLTEVRAGRPPAELRHWLFDAASALVVERGRRASGTRRSLAGAAGLDRVLEGLSVDARLGLLLSSEGFSGDEIAAAIGRSPDESRILMARARSRVRLRRELFGSETS